MNTYYTIKNFRVFNSKGVNLFIKPITILTGCNSSGKSSIVKSLLLLNTFLESVRSFSGKETPRLDFSNMPLSLLGNFESVLNKQSVLLGDKTCSFSYTITTPFWGNEIRVDLSFSLNEYDIQKNGYLKRIHIEDSDGNIIFGKDGGFSESIKPFFIDNPVFYGISTEPSNLSSFKSFFLASFLINHIWKDYWNAEGGYDHEGRATSFEESEYVQDQALTYLRSLESIIPKQTLKLVKNSRIGELGDLFDISEPDAKLLEKALKSNIIFYLPILEKLDEFRADSFKERITAMRENSNRIHPIYEWEYRFIDNLSISFTQSGYNAFSDFYRSLEDDFLNHHYEGRAFQIRYNEGGLKIDLAGVFVFLCELNPTSSWAIIEYDFRSYNSYYHFLHKAFEAYRCLLIKNILTTDVCQNISYVGSSRIDVKRVYGIEIGDTFSDSVTRYFEALRLANGQLQLKGRKGLYVPGTFLNRWLRSFSIGDRIEILPLDSGVGFTIKIFETSEDTNGRLLADYGYGISQLVSVILEVETAILFSDKLIAHFDRQRVRRTVAIEEPEIHLHPRYQSLLAEMFFDAYKEYSIEFIIETHSEYLLRKMQTLIGKKMLTPSDVSFVYVEDDNNIKDAGKKVREIFIKDDGRLASPFGSGFYDEADNLSMELFSTIGK